MTKADDVSARAKKEFPATVDALRSYLEVPAISCEEEHFDDVERLAEIIRYDLEKLGLDNARVLTLEGALPCVAAEFCHAKDKPTLLIYGHLDLQPVRGEPWTTEPHNAVEKDGRLYARGAADDMGGWVSHLAAIKAWLEETESLPINLKLLIEGEEEIGSPNLERFMDEFPDAFSSDIMVLTDCENPSTDIPGLTVSLRGLIEIDVTCSALASDVHSGLWGNMVPDVNLALMRAITGLTDDDGRLKLGRQEVDRDWQEAAWGVPLNDDTIRQAANLLPGADPLPNAGRPPAEWVWRQPAMTVLSTTIAPRGREKNALRTTASARLSVRVAPGQTGEELFALIEKELRDNPPAGVLLDVELLPHGASSWLYHPQGPVFDAADRAYKNSWGSELVQIGVGGSIPFVALFGRRFGDLPLILNGVMDPLTGAHGPNESMHLGVFEKAIRANVYLYDELSRL